MPSVITKQELIDASEDALTLEKVVNDAPDASNPGQPDGTVTTRLGSTFYNMQATLLSVTDKGGSLLWNFSNTTTMSDPGSKNIRLDNSDYSLAGNIAISATEFSGGDVSDAVASWNGSTDPIKGNLIVRGGVGSSAFAIYQVVAVSDNGTWLQAQINFLSGNGSFSDGSIVHVGFSRTGGTPSQLAFDTYQYTAIGGETSISGVDDNGNTLTYTPGAIFVSLEGSSLQNEIDYTATSGSSITGLIELQAGEVVTIQAFKTFEVTPHANQTTGVHGLDQTVSTTSTPTFAGGTYTGDVNFNGDVTTFNAGGSSNHKILVGDLLGSVRVGREDLVAYGDFKRESDGTIAIDAVQATFGKVAVRTASTDAVTISNTQAVRFPAVLTTASAANAFLDSGDGNNLLRSTSSQKYKTDIEDLWLDEALKILGMRPVWYRSLAEADPDHWSYEGLVAEEVAEIDPRFVHYAYADDQFEIVKKTREIHLSETVTVKKSLIKMINGVATMVTEDVEETRLVYDEHPVFDTSGEPIMDQEKPNTQLVHKFPRMIEEEYTERVLKEGAVKTPDGVQYERLTIPLLKLLQKIISKNPNLIANE